MKKCHVFDLNNVFLDDYLPYAKDRSTNTVTAYRDAMTLFHQFALTRGMTIDNFLFSDVTEDLMLDFRIWLRDIKKELPQTVNHRFSLVRNYIRYCGRNEVAVACLWMKLKEIPKFREEQPYEEALTEQQVELLLSLPANSVKAVRDRVIMILLYETAARVGEILGLRLENVDIDSSAPHIIVRGKGNKHRRIPLTKNTCGHIRYYNGLYHNERSVKTDLLFYGVRRCEADMLSEDCIQHMLEKYETKAKTTDPTFPHLHSHLLRRSKATHMGDHNIDIATISRYLGHAQVETTMVYVNPNQEHIRQAIEKSASEHKLFSDEIIEYERKRARLCGIR